MKYYGVLFLLMAILTTSCGEPVKDNPFPAESNPWFKIKKDRIEKLLPSAMKEAGVDMWLTLCRENNNDPLAKFIGGENASGTAAFIFVLEGKKVKSAVISGPGEATALKEIGLHDEVIVPEDGYSIDEALKTFIEDRNPKSIAINSSSNAITDGLSYSQKEYLVNLLGEKISDRFVSSDELVTNWLEIKLPEEIEIMKKAAVITAQMEVDAYAVVVPGVTKDSDLAKYLKKRMEEIGAADAWAADQNPSVNSGKDRGHSHASDKVIQPGDVIQIDFGIKVYDTWCSDIQRFAYVLKPGEDKAPEEIQKYFDNAIAGHRKVLAVMKPGVTGWDCDKVQREWLDETGSLPIMWGTGHAVGYWAHDIGPRISGAAYSDKPVGKSARILKPGMVFAYDGFYSWKLNETDTKTFSVEEMAVITKEGAKYLLEPQKELILIKDR